MDILDNYESASLATPVDAKNLSSRQKQLNKLQDTINNILYPAVKKDTSKFWDMLKAGAFNNV